MKRFLPVLFFLSLISELAYSAVFIVTNNSDSGPGSLRQAITDSNNNGVAVPDIIQFNLSGSSIADVTIQLSSELPALSSNLTIDGLSQPSSLLGNASIKVLIVNGSTMFFHGLIIENVGNIDISGLYFRGFVAIPGGSIAEKRGGIYLRNCQNITVQHCGFGNNTSGILSQFDLTANQFVDNLTVSSCLIGLSTDGDNAAPNEVGLDLSMLRNSMLGSALPLEGNLISSNTIAGIACAALEGSIEIRNNVIGYNFNRTKVFQSPAGSGMNVYANRPSSDVVISSNTIVSQKTGVYLEGLNNGFRLTSNVIGAISTSLLERSNEIGIHVSGSLGLRGIIGGGLSTDLNTISYNRQAIVIERSYPISILRNSIFCNEEGIVFRQPLPGRTVLTSSIDELTSTTAKGNYLPNSLIELFYDDECPDCQGKHWISSVNTDSDGKWEYVNPVPFTGGITSTGTNADGATSGFSKPVLVDQNKIVSGTFCGSANGSIRNINVTDASEFRWYNSSGQLVGTERDLMGLSAGSYYLIAGQPGGCQLRTEPYIISNTDIYYAVKSFTTKPATCEEPNGSITINSFETETPMILEWRDENDLIIGNGKMITDLPSGSYTLYGSNGNGCSNLIGVYKVGESRTPDIDLTTMIQLASCDGSSISISGISIAGESSPYNYAWFNEENLLVSDDLDLLGVPPGNYFLQVTDQYGCVQTTDLLDFTDISATNVSLTNSFTPNGDGVNDTWKITGSSNYPDADFMIYNRYGSLVFHSIGYDYEFDGTRNGVSLPPGVYYYFIDLKNDCPKISGSLTLIR